MFAKHPFADTQGCLPNIPLQIHRESSKLKFKPLNCLLLIIYIYLFSIFPISLFIYLSLSSIPCITLSPSLSIFMCLPPLSLSLNLYLPLPLSLSLLFYFTIFLLSFRQWHHQSFNMSLLEWRGAGHLMEDRSRETERGLPSLEV